MNMQALAFSDDIQLNYKPFVAKMRQAALEVCHLEIVKSLSGYYEVVAMPKDDSRMPESISSLMTLSEARRYAAKVTAKTGLKVS